QVARADKEAIDAVNCGNGFKVLQGQARFDLEDQANFIVGALEIVFDAAITIAAMADGHAANALGRIARRGDGGARFLSSLGIWNKEVLHADIKEALEKDHI